MTKIGAQGPSSTSARLVVEDLRIVLARTAADVVDEVCLTVQASEVLGLVGESGSGKTTVALALLGYHRRGLEVAAGRVVLEGRDLLAMSPAAVRAVRGAKVSYVPQDPASALNPALRVGAQLDEILNAHKNTASVTDVTQRVTEVLAEAHLDASPEFLRRYPHQLSGGQQQRIAIAMAFACRPSLIVLDEPTTGLDVTTQRHVLDTIRRLCRSYGVAAVYVSHDLAVVGQLAQQVAVMYAGRVVEQGPTEAIFNAPVHPYTRALLRAIPSPERSEVLQGIDGQPPRPAHRPRGCFFAPRCPAVLPVCRETPPPIVALDAGRHLVRCVRADEPVSPGDAARALSRPPSAGDQAEALEVRELSARYGTQPVLYGIDLRVGSEQCVAIVGESGSGKTTLARCLVGLHSDWTGDVLFCGEPLAKRLRGRTKRSLQRIQYVFQNPYTSLNPCKTVGQIVEQPLDHFSRLSPDERERRVVTVLDDVSLGSDFLNRYPDQLSGGERQRVAIARALVVEPELLVCDEVTSALDVSVQAIIVELLRRLQRERNLAILFITHNLALVRSVAQTVVVLSEGRVVEQGAVEEILERPRETYTIRLLEDVPKLAKVGADADRSP